MGWRVTGYLLRYRRSLQSQPPVSVGTAVLGRGHWGNTSLISQKCLCLPLLRGFLTSSLSNTSTVPPPPTSTAGWRKAPGFQRCWPGSRHLWGVLYSHYKPNKRSAVEQLKGSMAMKRFPPRRVDALFRKRLFSHLRSKHVDCFRYICHLFTERKIRRELCYSLFGLVVLH